TEPLENLEAYARALNKISELSAAERVSVLGSPKNTSIGRLDEYHASHPGSMILNWNEIPPQEL
ncbi:MAG: aminomethyl-transferring glycine dehydrogenase subunit GcvPB, partial [Nitrososphaerales archaeon]